MCVFVGPHVPAGRHVCPSFGGSLVKQVAIDLDHDVEAVALSVQAGCDGQQRKCHERSQGLCRDGVRQADRPPAVGRSGEPR